MKKSVCAHVHMYLGILVKYDLNFKISDQRKDNSTFAW